MNIHNIGFCFLVGAVVWLSGYMILSLSMFIAIVVIASVVLMAVCYTFPQFSNRMGWGARCIRENNNLQLATLVVFFLVVLSCAIKYGAGEPVFVNSLRSGKEFLSNAYTVERQIKTNKLVYGQPRANMDMKMMLDYFAQYEDQYPLQRMPKPVEVGYGSPEHIQSMKDMDEYYEKNKSYATFGVFASKDEVEAIRQKFATDFSWKNEWVQENEQKYKLIQDTQQGNYHYQKEENRTWFFWKMSLGLFLLIILYSPIAFSDEIGEKLDEIWTSVQSRQKEVQTDASGTPMPVTATASGAVAASEGVLAKFGKWISENATFEVIFGVLTALLTKIRGRRR